MVASGSMFRRSVEEGARTVDNRGSQWRDRLRNATQAAESQQQSDRQKMVAVRREVDRFFREVAIPALQELKAEFHSQGVDMEIEPLTATDSYFRISGYFRGAATSLPEFKLEFSCYLSPENSEVTQETMQMGTDDGYPAFVGLLHGKKGYSVRDLPSVTKEAVISGFLDVYVPLTEEHAKRRR